MAKSIRAEINELARIVEQRIQSGRSLTIAVDLITASTREEAEALLALPATPAPVADCTVRLAPQHSTAAGYLQAVSRPNTRQ